MAIKVNTSKVAIKIPFKDLGIGDCYRDGDGLLCIKTSASHCIFINDGGQIWSETTEKSEALVTPVKATLTIEE